MSDAPETIWATRAEMDTGSWNSEPSRMQEHMPTGWQVEYRRADLPPTREQIMADPRVMALVEALEGLLSITISTMAESERSIEYGEEDAFRMGEWFDEVDHALVMTARTALAALGASETDNEGETE